MLTVAYSGLQWLAVAYSILIIQKKTCQFQVAQTNYGLVQVTRCALDGLEAETAPGPIRSSPTRIQSPEARLGLLRGYCVCVSWFGV